MFILVCKFTFLLLPLSDKRIV